MKVLHFYKTYYPETFGGVEQVIYQICEGTFSLGVESEVLAISSSESRNSIIGNHHTKFCKSNFELLSTPFSIRAVSKLREMAKKADIVHYHFPWPFMDMAHFMANHGKPTIVTYHSDIVRQKIALKAYYPLMMSFLRSADRIIATSPNYMESSSILKKFSDKSAVIPIGLDEHSYPVPTDSVREKWKSLYPGRFFIFVGVLRYYKGLHFLLEAAKLAAYPILIIGSGPEESKLKTLARELKLDNVHFLGMLPEEDKIALLQLSYASVFPSHLRAEAFGISLLEAAMHGKPLVSCEIGTGTTYINNDRTGIIVPPECPAALAAAMKRLWENPAESESMGRNARMRFESKFTADLMSQKYLDQYNSILEKPGH